MIKHRVHDKILIEMNRHTMVNSYHDLIDIIASTVYEENNEKVYVALYKESLHEDFFDLKTRYAGEMLQKLTNYNIKMAVIGSFDKYSSNSLHDFIRESNRKGDIVFLDSLGLYLEMIKMARL